MSDLRRIVEFMRGPVTPKTPEEQAVLDEGAKSLARQHAELKSTNPVAAAALVLQHGDEIFRGRSLLASEQPEPPNAA